MTDSRSVTQLFQTKMNPQPLWSTCDFVFLKILTNAYIPEKKIFVAILYSRFKMDFNGEKILINREDIPTEMIKVNAESTGMAHEELVSFNTTDQRETTEKENWKREEETRRAIPTEQPVITVWCYYADDLCKDTSIVNTAQLTKPIHILKEQVSHPTIKSSNEKYWAYQLSNKM